MRRISYLKSMSRTRDKLHFTILTIRIPVTFYLALLMQRERERKRNRESVIEIHDRSDSSYKPTLETFLKRFDCPILYNAGEFNERIIYP